jgi:putative Mg2+ transporter-C (MgtC) family protein
MTAQDWEMMLRVLIAFALGAVIGFERESIHQPAGLRTHMLVSAGAACFSLASIYGFAATGSGTVDPGRVAAQIVTGVGFLGAGTIWRTTNTVRGLTTAASIWVVAAVGMLAAAGLYALAVFTTLIAAFVLRFMRTPTKRRQMQAFGEPSLVPNNKRGEDEEEDDVA